MENSYPVFEFETEVTEQGTLSVPPGIARTLRRGMVLTVRLTLGGVPAALRHRGVTESEVEQIASRQLARGKVLST